MNRWLYLSLLIALCGYSVLIVRAEESVKAPPETLAEHQGATKLDDAKVDGGANGARDKPDAIPSPNGRPAVTKCGGIDFGRYMSDLHRRIKRAWFPPRGHEMTVSLLSSIFVEMAQFQVFDWNIRQVQPLLMNPPWQPLKESLRSDRYRRAPVMS